MLFNKYILGGCAAAILVASTLAYFLYKQNQKLKEENQLNKIQIQNYDSQITDLKESFDTAQKDIDRLTQLNNSITSTANKRKIGRAHV